MQGSQDAIPEQTNYEQGPAQQHGAGWNPNDLPAEDNRQSTFTIDLRSFKKPGEKLYTQRSRLFVGNLPAGVTEQDVEKLFSKYGKPAEIFINKERGFGFVRLETRILAEIAKAELDDFVLRGRQLRVRFAAHGAALAVKNLPQFVSNELLEEAFSTFGQVERAVVVVDDRGRPTGKGFVDFTSKAAARKALERCAEGAFLLTAYPRPVTVEPMEQLDEEEGQPERVINKNQQFHKEREQLPRFAQPGTFEYEYAMRWKALLDMEKQQQEQVDRNIREAREKLESEMVAAQHEHQVMLMRQDLLRRQEELRRMEEQHNLEVQKRKQAEMRQEEERRRRSEEAARRQQEAFAENREKDMRIHLSGQGMPVGRSYMAGSTLPAGAVNMPDVEKSLMHERFPAEQAVSDAMLGAVPPFPRGLSTPPDFGINKRRGY